MPLDIKGQSFRICIYPNSGERQCTEWPKIDFKFGFNFQGPFVAAFASANLGDVSPNLEGPKCIDTGLVNLSTVTAL